MSNRILLISGVHYSQLLSYVIIHNCIFYLSQMESSSPDSYQHWENHRDNSRSSQNNGMPRLRLFKTRAETKHKLSKDELKNAEIHPQVPQSSNLHRSMSSPQFQVSIVIFKCKY